MLFNSLDFGIFFSVVFVLYWFVFDRHLRAQNVLVLVASYVFYGWWDWRFLSLIVISSTVDFIVGRFLDRARGPGARRALLLTSLGVNLGMLGFFKYFDFFVDSFVQAFETVGISLHPTTLHIVLPVGISFYTFQTLSYTIDIYRRRISASSDPIAFFAFVAFFPQLVAGPIERAARLLPQFERTRRFDAAAAADGLRQVLYGLFKKVVVADGCAAIVDAAFAGYTELDGASLAIGAVCFSFQIYCDFSGYSDIAIGTAKVLGFDLMRNFANPFFSRDIAEFWRRWHISLSTWFRDYLFIPLGGSRGTTWQSLRNIFVTFIVSGLWHGANWTFVAWGFLNALYYLPVMLARRQRRYTDLVAEERALPTLREAGQILTTFALTALAFVFFRSTSIDHAFGYLERLFSPSLFGMPALGKQAIIGLVAFVAFEWFQRRREHGLEIGSLPLPVRWGAYWAVALAVLVLFQGEKSFIYFQF